MTVREGDTVDPADSIDGFGVKPTSLGARSSVATQRQQEIASLTQEYGQVDVNQLAGVFAVTTETIRRDLKLLERADLVKRIHGGAVATRRLVLASPLPLREVTSAAEKNAIARAALHLLPSEGAILIDAGTTTLRLADLMPSSKLTVVTNALPIGLRLSRKPGVNVHMMGGRLRPETQASVDTWALAFLSNLRVDVAFLGTNGVSVEQGFSTPDPDEAAVKQAMVKTARVVVVLADHTKLHTEYFSRFASLTEVQYLVTDWGASEEDLDPFRRSGVKVIVANPVTVPSRTGSALQLTPYYSEYGVEN